MNTDRKQLTDRELIERAARANFGVCYKGDVKWVDLANGGFWEALTAANDGSELGYERFDPLHYDEDALRLVLACKIELMFIGKSMRAAALSGERNIIEVVDIGYTTGVEGRCRLREAIVMAAAALTENQ